VHKHYWPLPEKEVPKSTDPPPTDSPTDDPPDVFETQVLIPFIGNPYNPSKQKKRVLEQAFLETYTKNKKRGAKTSPLQVLGLLMIQMILILAILNTNGSKIQSKIFGAWQVSGICRGCQGHTRVLADDVQNADKRHLGANQLTHHYLWKGMHDRAAQEAVCVGLSTNEDFVALYNEEIVDLRSSGVLENVSSVNGSTVEKEPLPEEECGALSDFVAVAHVEVNADSEPSEEELAILADSFVRSDNQAMH
jgi:hypothetical protein